MTPAVRLLTLLICSVYAQVSPLIETHELSAKLQRGEGLHILEVINLGETRDASLDSRIPLAQYLPLKSLLTVTGLIVKAPDLPAFKETMKTLGIKKDGPLVVLYDSKGMKGAAMAWWVLRAYGKVNVQVLNGGLPKWLRDGFMQARGNLPALLDPRLENDLLYNYILDPRKYWNTTDLQTFELRPHPTSQVIDVRPRSEFNLQNIPGSLHLPNDIITLADGSLRSEIELRAIFEGYQVSIAPEMKTVAMSENGIEAAEILWALETLGKGNGVLVNGGWQAYVQASLPVGLVQVELCEGQCHQACSFSLSPQCLPSCLQSCTACSHSCSSICHSSLCFPSCFSSFCSSSSSTSLLIPFFFLVFALLSLLLKYFPSLRKPTHFL